MASSIHIGQRGLQIYRTISLSAEKLLLPNVVSMTWVILQAGATSGAQEYLYSLCGMVVRIK